MLRPFSRKLRFWVLPSTAALILIPIAVVAQVSTDNSDIAKAFNLGTNTDLKQIIINLVSYLLTFLGLAAVIVVLYSGYLWMTAAGNEQRIESAKSTLRAGIIGLALILSAYAITQFAIDTVITKVTNSP
jgi:hypothetical protein